jgi:hypothetical protein
LNKKEENNTDFFSDCSTYIFPDGYSFVCRTKRLTDGMAIVSCAQLCGSFFIGSIVSCAQLCGFFFKISLKCIKREAAERQQIPHYLLRQLLL